MMPLTSIPHCPNTDSWPLCEFLVCVEETGRCGGRERLHSRSLTRPMRPESTPMVIRWKADARKPRWWRVWCGVVW